MSDHTAHGPAVSDLTRMAITATLHCLTGCAIGEVLGLVIATALGLSNIPSIALAVALAFVFGYSLTLGPVLRTGLSLKQAIGIALAADTVSIIVMEIMDNAFMLAIPGAMAAGLADVLFWASLVGSLIVAFVITVPVNRALIARGKATPWSTPCTAAATWASTPTSTDRASDAPWSADPPRLHPSRRPDHQCSRSRPAA